jgi:hypothetical protein
LTAVTADPPAVHAVAAGGIGFGETALSFVTNHLVAIGILRATLANRALRRAVYAAAIRVGFAVVLLAVLTRATAGRAVASAIDAGLAKILFAVETPAMGAIHHAVAGVITGALIVGIEAT